MSFPEGFRALLPPTYLSTVDKLRLFFFPLRV